MEDEMRKKAGRDQLGMQRYLRYVAAFDHVMDCCKRGYHLEAIAVLDSLIGDRLASRLGHLLDEEVPVRLTIGQLSRKLLDPPAKNVSSAEVDSVFQAVVKDIRAWMKDRNRAMHAIAKIIHDREDARHFDELLESHRSIVEKGIALLQTFDKLDTAARQKNEKYPATWPDAFFPEQRWTLAAHSGRVRN